MAKPEGRSVNDPLPEHLVHLEGVTIHATHFERMASYQTLSFEVKSGDEIIKVLCSDDSVEWIEAHKDDVLDMTIFPYEWELQSSGKSGVVNYLRHAAVAQTPN